MSIRRRDSNPRPIQRESPPITTRPGLLRIYAFDIFVPTQSYESYLTLHNNQNYQGRSEERN